MTDDDDDDDGSKTGRGVGSVGKTARRKSGDTLKRVVPGELWLPLLQDVHDTGLPQKGHDLVVVC